jgi:hypothetical protein
LRTALWQDANILGSLEAGDAMTRLAIGKGNLRMRHRAGNGLQGRRLCILEKRRTDMATLKIAACIAVAMIALPAASFAQGASREAPGQEQKYPGQAKKFAPGQQEKIKNKDNRPGAKEYAPGHEMKK